MERDLRARLLILQLLSKIALHPIKKNRRMRYHASGDYEFSI